MEDKNPIQSAGRIFNVLETLAKHGAMGLTELSVCLSLNKSTTHRLLSSLISMKYVRQDPNTNKYILTFKLVSLAGNILDKIDIVSIAKPYLEKLVAYSHETVHFVQRDRNHIIYIDKVESSENSVRMVSHIGLRHPLYCTGVGKAMMAYMSEDEIIEIWNTSNIQKRTSYTITNFDDFMEELHLIKKLGYALDNEENEIGVRCIAACVLDYQGKANNAFSISAPIQRMSDYVIEHLSDYVLQVKNELSIELGYVPKSNT